jgi:hypothetical protein
MPVAIRRLSPATRTMKNSSRLLAEDRQEPRPLQQRDMVVRVGGELQDALVELQPRDLAVQEAVAGGVTGSTLVQWKATTSSVVSSTTRSSPAGSNHGWAIRSCRSARVSRPCSGWLAKAAALSATQRSSSTPGCERAHREPLRHSRIDRVLGSQRPAHDVQLTRDDQPGGSSQRRRRGQHAVRPDAVGTLRHHLVEQGPTVPATTTPRVHDQLGHGIRPARLSHLRIPDDGVVLVQAHQVDHALAGRADRQPERLGDGFDAVGVLRPSEQVARISDAVASSIADRRVVRGGRVTSGLDLREGVGDLGDEAVPDVADGPDEHLVSVPSLARSRRTWTSTVRVPPK